MDITVEFQGGKVAGIGQQGPDNTFVSLNVDAYRCFAAKKILRGYSFSVGCYGCHFVLLV